MINSIDVSIVLPTYNEAQNIIPLLEDLDRELAGRAFEVLVVDDDSPDGTWNVAQDFAARHPFVRVVRRKNARGLSSAVVEGFRQSRGRFLGVMDADRSHDVRILGHLIGALEKGADIAVGSRRVPGGGADHWPWYRQMTSQIATGMAHLLLGIGLKDPMSGYFLMKRELFEQSADRLKPTGYKILLEIVVKARPRSVVEVPFIFKDRIQGYSKLSHHVILAYLGQLISLAGSAR